DLAAGQGSGAAVGMAYREGVRALVGDDSVDRVAARRGHGVVHVFVLDGAVRVEDGDEEGLGRAVGEGGEVGSDRIAESLGDMAGEAGRREDDLPRRRIAL